MLFRRTRCLHHQSSCADAPFALLTDVCIVDAVTCSRFRAASAEPPLPMITMTDDACGAALPAQRQIRRRRRIIVEHQEDIWLSQQDLAARYQKPLATIRYWRHSRTGPQGVRIGRQV